MTRDPASAPAPAPALPTAVHGALYVTNFTDGVSEDDLRELVGKLLAVSSVYVPAAPPTGLKRAFAMVRVLAADVADIAACARKLNNCQWKGCRLRIEVAARSYEERLAAERADLLAAQRALQLAAEPQALPFFDPAARKGVLRLLRIPKQHEYVSCVAGAAAAGSVRRGRQQISVRPMGRRTAFEYNADGSLLGAIADVALFPATGASMDRAAGLLVEYEECSAPAPGSGPGSGPTPAAASQAAGSGRKGFGTLLEKAATSQRDNLDPRLPFQLTREARPLGASLGYGKDDCCVEWGEEVDDDELGGRRTKGASFADPALMSHSEFSSGQQDSDDEGAAEEQTALRNRRVRGLNDDSDDDDVHIPSCAAEELEPEALLGERQRALALFASMMSGGGVHMPGGGDDGDGLDVHPAQQPQQQQQRLNKRGWEAVRETAALRFDPTAEDGGASFVLDAEEKQALLRRVREREQERAQRLGLGLLGTGFGAAGTADADAEVEVDRADLGELKGIFSKAAGVWFGDDGGLGQAVQRGGGEASTDGADLDDIFLAAERRGIDVRVAEPSAAMTFSFFDGPDSAGAPQESFAKGARDSGVPSGAAPAVEGSYSVDENSRARNADSDEENQDPNSQFVVLSVTDYCSQARSFCRAEVASDELLRAQWQEQRERGVVDIKRRVHDMRRKNRRLGVTAGSSARRVGPGAIGASVSASSKNTTAQGALRKRGGRRGQGGKGRH